MGKSKYYRQWIGTAFGRSIWFGDGLAFLLAIIFPIIRQIIPGWETTMNELAWQIPALGFGAIVLVRLMLAPYWIYKKIEKERDGLLGATSQNGVIVLERPPALFIDIQDSHFGLSGGGGFPPCDSSGHEERWLRLSIVFEGNVYIETLELAISGKTPIPAHGWKPGKAAYYYYFQIPNWVKAKEERTIQVRAFANSIPWGSPEKSITFAV